MPKREEERESETERQIERVCKLTMLSMSSILSIAKES